jgi:hypothetical protein
VNRSKLRAQVQRAVLPTLDGDESITDLGPAWFVEPGAGVPTLFRRRRVFGLATTERRVVVVRLPRRRAATVDDVAVDERLDACRLVRLRSWTPLQQVWLRRPDGRELILELRRAQRRTGRAIASAASGATTSSEMPEGEPSPS